MSSSAAAQPSSSSARGSRKDDLKRSYRTRFLTNPQQFMETLSNNIMHGPAQRHHALTQIDVLTSCDRADLLERHRVNGDESLLQLAAIFHGDVEVMSRLATACPSLLLLQRQGEYEGQTVLHALVSKQNVEAATALLEHPCLREPWILLSGKATGPRFFGTVMMGELPLSVAALTFNADMVDVLLKNGAKLHAVNSRGDTALHSLVRFAALYKEREGQVVEMMQEMHKRLQSPGATPAPQADPRSVWLMENKEGLTVLRLAAALAQPAIFRLALELEGVYCQLDRHDGLFDSLLYDVTEIDPIARRSWRQNNVSQRGSPVSAMGMPSPAHLRLLDVGCCPGADTPAPSAIKGDGATKEHEGPRSVSVLEIICETGRVEKAFEILNTYVVRNIVKEKWRHYRAWFVAWGLLHLLLMTLLTAYAIYKAEVIADETAVEDHNQNATPGPAPSGPDDAQHTFVKAASILILPLSAVILFSEVLRLKKGQPLNLWLIHHNGLYRVELVIFALSLIADSIWFWVPGPNNNFFLILALLIGWWFTTFFLRPLQKFSFFTVMLQKVFLGDMLRFSVIIGLELLAFSVAMHVIFVATSTGPPEGFTHLGHTALTMFKLMLGLGEIEVLNEASHPWLAITLFVLFVLLTYILMLNALIAMMSNTCSLVSENKVSQWELQRLSVILMLESMMPCECLFYNSGRPLHVARYDLRRKQVIQEVRYFTKVTSVQTNYGNGAAILKRKSMMQTQRFEDIQASVLAMGNVGHIDLLASFTHQQALLGSGSLVEEDSLNPPPGIYPTHYQSQSKSFSAYGSFRKPQGFAGEFKRELSAIKEQPEGDPEGRGGQGQGEWQQGQGQGQSDTSYINVRQSLLQALMASQFAAQMNVQRMRAGAGQQSAAPSAALTPQDPSLAEEEEECYDSEDGRPTTEASTSQPTTPQVPQRSPHTPKAVKVQEVEPAPGVTRKSSKRKRHNSDRVKTNKLAPPPLDKAKSLDFPAEQGKQSDGSQELAPLRTPEVRERGQGEERSSRGQGQTLLTQMLSGRQLTRVQPKLPSPDIFMISHKQGHASDA